VLKGQRGGPVSKVYKEILDFKVSRVQQVLLEIRVFREMSEMTGLLVQPEGIQVQQAQLALKDCKDFKAMQVLSVQLVSPGLPVNKVYLEVQVMQVLPVQQVRLELKDLPVLLDYRELKELQAILVQPGPLDNKV
jgi:hypothetical protein